MTDLVPEPPIPTPPPLPEFPQFEDALVAKQLPEKITQEIGNQLIREQGLDIVIPDSAKVIADGAFSWDDLKSVDIPDSVSEIGEEAFSLNKLKRVVIPASINEISR